MCMNLLSSPAAQKLTLRVIMRHENETQGKVGSLTFRLFPRLEAHCSARRIETQRLLLRKGGGTNLIA